jgi:TolB-like protein/Tfp pilus assembly protein PilF
MTPVKLGTGHVAAGANGAGRLDSWKEIAGYLGRSERTVRRWEESEDLPVHRLQHEKRGSVYAYRSELDRWWESRKATIDPPAAEPPGITAAVPSENGGGELAPDDEPVLASHPRKRIWIGLSLFAAAIAIAGLTLTWWKTRIHPGAAGRIHSIAVLPLRNLTADPKQEYFTDGATDALISNLAQIHSVRVISFTSVMRFKGTTRPLPEIGRELGVDGIVEGSVQQDGGRVRISAQLIEAATDKHLWAEVYDRERSDMLKAQSEIARAIAREIQGRLTPEEDRGLQPPGAIAAAQDEYFLGHDHLWRMTEQEQLEALRHFQEAVRLQPDYAEAWSQIAAVFLQRALFTGGVRFRDAEQPALEAAAKGLEFGPGLALTHDIQGDMLMYFRHDWEAAEREFQRAIALNGNSFDAHADYACFLAAEGRFPEMFVELDRAVALDPQNSFIQYVYGKFAGMARQSASAEQHLRRALELDPKNFQAQRQLVTLIGFAQGDPKRALSMLEEQIQARGGDSRKDILAGMLYAGLGRRAEASEVLANVTAQGARTNTAALAAFYFVLGNSEHGFHALQQMFDEGGSIFAAHDPAWDLARSDPRFQAQIRRLGLPQ